MKRLFSLLMLPVMGITLTLATPVASAQEKKEGEKAEGKKKAGKKKKGEGKEGEKKGN